MALGQEFVPLTVPHTQLSWSSRWCHTASWRQRCTISRGCFFSRFVSCVLARDTSESHAWSGSLSGRKLLKENLWREFFLDPSQWWDHRAEKLNPKFPDFKHKKTQHSLWLIDKSTPPWVEAKLAALAPGTLQSHIFAWHVRLRRHVKAGDYKKTLKLFQQMQQEGLILDEFTFVPVLNACSSLRFLEEGRRVHEQIIQRGCESDVYIASCLVDMYSKCGSIEDAWTVFSKMRESNVVCCNAMIAGYVKSGQGPKAMELFRKMQQEGLEPTAVTFVGVLNACASLATLEDGRLVHKQIIERGYEYNVYVGNCLVDMYSKCGSIGDAWSVFNKMGERNVVSWNAMIGGYVKSGQGTKAMELYRQMQQEGVEADSITFIGVLEACGRVAALKEGRRVHQHIIRRGCETDVCVATCLVDMYSKCGNIEDASRVFNKMQVRDGISWSAMIGGYAMHGHAEKSIRLFKRMSKEGGEIDRITFTCLLSACSHGGLVKEGLRYFESMTLYYNISPALEHYSCMVDLLGRAGRLQEAEEMTKRMPMKGDASLWLSLLGACGVHRNIKMAERAAKRCWELNPENASGHVLLSNIYAAAGKWDRSAAMGDEKLENRGSKEPSVTWIEVDNIVHAFVENDEEHPQILDIHAELEILSLQMNGWRGLHPRYDVCVT